MGHPYHHALSTVRQFGGTTEDYQPIHDFLDSTKATYALWRHRAILHNSFGIFLAERIFGTTITNSVGRQVPVRVIAETHVREDLGHIPTVKDWLDQLPAKPWMIRGVAKADRDGIPDADSGVWVYLTVEELKAMRTIRKRRTAMSGLPSELQELIRRVGDMRPRERAVLPNG